ncbi:MAG: amidase [Chloroflexi bacterium]|nr:amidase [Chloroflexota bacterium]
MTDLAWMGITEASSLMRGRELSPVEYVEALFRRADALDDRLHAYIHPTREIALRSAREAEAEIAAGRYRGTLHGIPYGLKDIIDYAGVPTTAHSTLLEGNVPDRDAAVTERLTAAGCVLMGKMATHEFALGGPSWDLPWPPPRNPWNTDHFTGGSSSGSAAAVAAGLLPAALGTDTGGSVRGPASLCGIVGMKPTYGRVSRRGVFPLAFTLDTVGPLTRTVEDNALLLTAIAGHDPLDPASARVPVPDFAADPGAGVRGLRVGLIRHFYAKDMVADPEVSGAVEEAVEVLAGLGAEVRELQLEPLELYAACSRTLITSEAYAVHEKWLRERPDDYGASLRQRLLPGAFVRAVDYVHATRLRRRLVEQFEHAMEGFDVAVTVSSMDPPPRIEDADEIARTYPRQARQPFNVIGVPALALPVGYTRSGLPLSMQIAGRAFEEAAVYRAAAAYEQATDWISRRPPLD